MRKLLISTLSCIAIVCMGCQNSFETGNNVNSDLEGENAVRGVPSYSLMVMRIDSTNRGFFTDGNGTFINGSSSVPGKVRACDGGYHLAFTYPQNTPAGAIGYEGAIEGLAFTTKSTVDDWQQLSGASELVDIATNRTVTVAVKSDGKVYKDDGAGLVLLGGVNNDKVTRIDLDGEGNIWTVTEAGSIYFYDLTANSLEEMVFDEATVKAVDVGCGTGSLKFVVGDNGKVYRKMHDNRFSVGTLTTDDGNTIDSVIRVDVDKLDNIWIVDGEGSIWFSKKGTTFFEKQDGAGSGNIDIGA